MEPSDDFIFRSGVHEGKTYGEIRKSNPGYISWVKENRPQMLKEHKPKVVEPQTPGARKEVPEESSEPKSSLQPNLDFLNQINEKQF